MLSKEEIQRYNRQILLPEIGISGQAKLKNAKVLIIGAGGLGCPVLQYLTAAGVGNMAVVDDDLVDVSNLHRQILYSLADMGKPKAQVAKEKMNLLNHHVNIAAHVLRLTADNAMDICQGYDIVIDGSDNFETRYLVNDTCASLNIPLVFGSIFKFEGHISVFNYLAGPNYRDVFPTAPLPGEVPNCAEIGVLGVLPGIIGLYMANEALKIMLGIGETLSGKLMTINALTNEVMMYAISQKEPMLSLSDETTPTNPEITREELAQWQTEFPDDLYLVDVREAYEFEDFNMGGVNIPLYELAERMEVLPQNKKIIFCCQTGQRSKMAIHLLSSTFTGSMYSLQGGISQGIEL